jgi:hypothetical protein
MRTRLKKRRGTGEGEQAKHLADSALLHVAVRSSIGSYAPGSWVCVCGVVQKAGRFGQRRSCVRIAGRVWAFFCWPLLLCWHILTSTVIFIVLHIDWMVHYWALETRCDSDTFSL